MLLKRWIIFALLLVGAAAWAADGAPLPSNVKRIRQLEGVTEYRLANGLQVLLAPDSSKPTTTVNVTYRVGSRMESYGETGMAHLLEHLMFKGTPHHKNITAELTRRGMDPNGTTWFDRTNYFESFAASPQNLDWALHMEADRMVNSYIARKDLDSEMTVVRNEMESGENDPNGILMDKIMAAAFLWHNYGKSTIGARSDVENVNIAHLQAFYRKYYQPDNATLVVAGRFDESKTLAIIADTFGKIKKPKRTLEPTYTLDPVQDGEREVTLRRTGDIQYIEAVYHTVPAASPDNADFRVLANVLGDTPSGRLHKVLVETGLATSTGADSFNLAEPGVIYFEAEVRKDQSLEAVRKAFLDTIEDLHDHPVTDVEVERAKTNLLNDIEKTFNDPEKFGISLSTAIANGDWRLFFLNRDRIGKVKTADVERVADEYLKPSNRTLGIFIPTAKPDRAPSPARADAEAQLKGYHGNPDFMAGEAFDDSPENIQKRTQWVELADGLKMALLPKKTRGQTVHAQITLHFGTAENLLNKGPAASFAGGLLDKGAAGLTREGIQDRFTALNARVGFSGSATGATVVIDTVRANLPATLALVTEILKKPQFPESEFKQLREAELAEIEQGRTDPQIMAANALNRYFNRHPRGDVRYTATFDEAAEDVKSVTLEQVRSFYQQYYGADHAEVAIVGDFDAAQARGVLEKSLDGWKSGVPYAPVLDDFKPFAGTRIQLASPDKANAVFLVRQPIHIMDSDEDAPALMLGNYILGDGFLNSRLAMRIRQKEGISYGVGSYLRLNDQTRNSSFGAYAIYAPQNLSRLEAAFSEEIDRVIRQGFTPDEIDSAKSAMLQSRQLARAQDGVLAGMLVKLMHDHRNMEFVAGIDQKLKGLDVAAVNQAIHTYLDPRQFAEVVAGDFQKKP
jgi:zinc protease